MTNLALFYLRMQAKMLLPATTISALIGEFQELHTNGMAHVLTIVSQELEKLKIQRDRIHEIVDAFEVANPLGSGKKKHKLLAVYLTMGEILPHNRSAIDPMQLVMLCRDVDSHLFGHDKIFSPLVNDLREIEESGFVLDNGETLQGTVIAIAGDDLGSHALGGFTENFSRSKHFCRYCLIDRESFEREPTKLGPLRTKETYANCLEELSKGQEVMIAGLKFDSIFNRLKHFHVCQPGLPPCLGHDLFEGIVSADLAMYIKNLVSVGKHFSYVQLNRSISQLKFHGSDASSRPCEVKSDGLNLGGSAAQNWCLLRLLPILVALNSEIELICAPKIHVNQVAYLKIIIRSKHTYFKQCARKLHHFKNLGVTLAERHQLLQAYLHCGNIFPPILQVGQAN
ncbi:hypothetical protein PO909_024803 [Leuciscus waleckii]